MRFILLTLFAALTLHAEVTRIYGIERSDVLDGRPFGAAGPYERIIAKAHFAVDPAKSVNLWIKDLAKAPANEKGLVEFTADLYVLKPRDPAKGNGTLLFEVPNRGGKGMLSRFNFARSALDPRTPEDFGDMMLLEQGFTLVWLGWQWDVPQKEHLLRLDAPILNGVTGLVRSEFIPDARTNIMQLGDRGHIAYTALPGEMTFTVRDTVLGRRRALPSSQWKLNANRTAIEMESGFSPGLIYELVYTSQNPRVVGAGLLAVRDIISFFKYTKNGVSLLGDQPRFIKRALGFGISQSGRFLRTFLYYGMNEDEQKRKVFDGIWADVAGAGRGSFNHTFAQASRDGYAHFNTLYATDIFPFTDVPQIDWLTREDDGLLKSTRPEFVPKIFYTNGSWEYWNRVAALVHVSTDGKMDAPLPPTTRLYAVAGSQHGPGQLPRTVTSAQFPTNPNETRPLQRALLIALHEWVRDGKEPPASRYPMIGEEQLVPRDRIIWPKTMKAPLPEHPKAAYRMDGEPENPKPGKPFPVLLPQVDADGIELGGIRLPVVAAPLGVFTGWNYRSPATGSPKEMAPTLGAFFAFSKDQIATRYGAQDAYLKRIGDETDKLVKQRFLLERDRAKVLDHATQLWDFVGRQ
jgi:Alpha/beta hydrolase domain